MADTVGVSKSAISRDTIEAAEKKIDELFARRFDDVDLLVIYVDGLIFSGHTVLAAVGVDAEGNKHVLGLQHAATENAAAAEDLLTGLVERGVSPAKKRLFVLDGSKALRAAVHKIFGDAPVQRCRAHKLRNVLDRLPKAEQDQAKAAIRAAWRLEAKDGQARLKKLAEWYAGDWAPRRRRVCARVSRSVSRSIAWDCRRRCIVVWRRPTSSRVRTPACGGGHVA